MNADLPRWLAELERMLESVQALRETDTKVHAERGIALVVHEVRRFKSDGPIPQSRAALLTQLEQLTAEERRVVRVRSLYYATHDLVALLAQRNIRRDAVACEEAVLYVHERLQRDDFRRLDGFDPSHGASFKTYMWQIVSRLLIDFLRSRRSQEDRSAANDSIESIESCETSAEGQLSETQLRESIAELFADGAPAIATRNALRDRLRAHIELTSTERLFLKAIFQHELSIDEVRRLPGFEMSSAEAWRYYYRLLERLLDCFKNADALDALRALSSSGDVKVEVAIGPELAKVDVTRIRYVKQLTPETTSCHADWRGRLSAGVIADSFTRVKKKLAPWFTAINATTLVADDQLRDMHDLWRREEAAPLRIPGVDESFDVGRTQWAALQRRYGGKNPGNRSYMDHGVDAADTAGRGQGS